MNIPKTLKIGAHQYQVIFPYQFKERTIDNVYCGFRIGKECHSDDLIESIAQGLAQVYIDNPGLRRLTE